LSAQREELSALKRRQFELETTIDALYVQQQLLLEGTEEAEGDTGLDAGADSREARRAALEAERCETEEVLRRLRAEIRSKFAEYDAAFHPRWGQVRQTTAHSSALSVLGVLNLHLNFAAVQGGLPGIKDRQAGKLTVRTALCMQQRSPSLIDLLMSPRLSPTFTCSCATTRARTRAA
jgi:hypothetical protein